MRFMNEWDIDRAYETIAGNPDAPNLSRAVITLATLVEWTNSNSDGWAYWPKPCRAAGKLQALIQGAYDHDDDVTAAELTAALTPVKAFLTRQGVNHGEVIK